MRKDKKKQLPYKLGIPGFLVETQIGLGDVIKRATSAIGIKTCGGCEQRASILNNLFVFKGKTDN